MMRLNILNNKFDGWHLDIDRKTKPKKSGKWTIGENLMLREQDGIEWTAILVGRSIPKR